MNLLWIDSSVEKYELFVNSVNTNTIPIVYFPHTTREELLGQCTQVDRIAIASYSDTRIEGEPLWSDANVEFMKRVIDTYQVKHIDFLACNTLDDPRWNKLFTLPVIVGASDNKTGNLKYGGDWIMETTSENVETIYFTESIQYYTYLLDSIALLTSVVSNRSLYIQGNLNVYFSKELTTFKKVAESYSAISCGSYYTVGIKNGLLYGCGGNPNGQLGNGTTDNKSTFTAMTSVGQTFTKVAASFTTVALTSTGLLYTCGADQLTGVNNLVLTAMTQPAGVTFTDIACGYFHTVAISSTGLLYSSGSNQYGQLGIPGGNRTAMTFITSAGATFTQIACGAYHTVALTSTGLLYAWGRNNVGQLGIGTLVDKNVLTPVIQPYGGVVFTQIACGTYHTVALTSTGLLYACGRNQFGQLGDGTLINKTVLVPMTLPSATFTKIACGLDYTIAISTTGMYGCGANQYGQLGDGTVDNKSILTALPSTFTQVSCGYYHTVGINTDVYSCGDNSYGQLGNGNVGNKQPFTLVSTMDSYAFNDNTIHVIKNGLLYAYGYNQFGQLGDGTLVNKSTLTAMTPVGVTFIKVESSVRHTVALTSTGLLYACGRNQYGQLGDGTFVDKNVLTPMTLPEGVVFTQIACGTNHTVALTSTGLLYGCGDNFYGQLGDGTLVNKNILTPMTSVGAVFTQIACGFSFTIALTSSGLYGCGDNLYGQLGDGTTVNKNILTPMTVGGTFTHIACGYYHTIALSSTGVYACGSNQYGQLGDGTTVDKNTLTAMQLPYTTIHQIACGAKHSVVYTSSGIYACGYNLYGQIDLTSTNYSTLTQVDTSSIANDLITYTNVPIIDTITSNIDLSIVESYLQQFPKQTHVEIKQFTSSSFTNVNMDLFRKVTKMYAIACPPQSDLPLRQFMASPTTLMILSSTIQLSDNNVVATISSNGTDTYLNGRIWPLGATERIGRYGVQLVGNASSAVLILPDTPVPSRYSSRSIGTFRAGTTTLGSATVSRDQHFAAGRAMVVQKVEQNRIPKVGVLDSSQRTSLRVASLGNLRTQFATRNGNDVKSALIRTRNAGAVAPKKKNKLNT